MKKAGDLKDPASRPDGKVYQGRQGVEISGDDDKGEA
jgi:hypothetical protein